MHCAKHQHAYLKVCSYCVIEANADALLKSGALTPAEAARLRSGDYVAGVGEKITHRPKSARRTK